MPFIKIVKNNAYHKRFQVKFRRRRECKTDYQARKALILQDKNKYNSPKYRLVVRFSNKDVTCQIAYATLKSDVILCAAYSHELSKYGAKLYKGGGQKNYAAAYATGLLLARRVLAKLGLDKSYVGQTKPDGKDFKVKKEKGVERRPFLVLLDVGLHFTTTGARVFGVMKGAVDGGLSIPHKNKRFPGYNHSAGKFDPSVLRKYIFGGHVAAYMKQLQADNPDKYRKQFSKYIAAGVGPDDVEKMWATVHSNIRKDPSHTKVVRAKAPKKVKYNKSKLTNAERKQRVAKKLASATKIVPQ
jgi:large subunit ribosomal protein L5e